MLAATRPTDWNWLLLFHLVFAFLVFGGALAVATVSLAAGRRAWPDQVPLLRAIAFRTNLVVVVPALIGLHVFGGLLSNREYHGHEPNWLSIGFSITSAATIVAVVLVFIQFWVLRRTRAGELGGWSAQAANYLPALVLAALVTVIVLMAGKPVG
jgi:hypothetical protein